MAIVYDNIRAVHTLRFGIPQPTDNAWGGNEPLFKQAGVYIMRLNDFPVNDLPSGGMTDRVSPSEMAMAYLKVENYQPKNDAVTFTWFRGKKVLAKQTTPDFKEGKAPVYWSSDWSFIGHFDWEINKPCTQYSVHIETAWGDALINFQVT